MTAITDTPGYQLWEARLTARVARADLVEAMRANMRRRGHYTTAARLTPNVPAAALDLLAERMRDDEHVTTAHARFVEAQRAVSDAAHHVAEVAGIALDRLLTLDGETPAA